MDPEQEEYEDLTGEAVPLEVPAQLATKQVARPMAPAQAQVNPEVIENRYAAYHTKEVKGVLDRETNSLLPDLDSQMAELLNKVERIDKKTG